MNLKFWGKNWCLRRVYKSELELALLLFKLILGLLLGRKAVTNLDSTLKSRDITLSTKVRLVKAMVFPVVMYGCESWTVKKAEHRRIDAFELWCWRRVLRVPWTARRSSQTILKEIWVFIGRTDVIEAEMPMLWLLDAKNWLTGKDPDAGKDWRWEEKGTTGWDGWMASPTQWTWVWVNSGSWWWTEAWCTAVQGVPKSRTRLSDWTELNWGVLNKKAWC